MSRLARLAVVAVVAPVIATLDACAEFYEALSEIWDYALHDDYA